MSKQPDALRCRILFFTRQQALLTFARRDPLGYEKKCDQRNSTRRRRYFRLTAPAIPDPADLVHIPARFIPALIS